MPSAPLRLRCEFVNNPLGVANTRPRFSWWVSDTRPAEIQSAYELVVASDRNKLEADLGDLWSTGRIEGSASAAVEYAGRALTSVQLVWWKVRTFDSDGVASPWSETAWFEMGLLDPENWQGDWISTPSMGSRSQSTTVPALRREFQVARTPLRARLFIAVLGDYRAYLNGSDLEAVVCPMVWSDYGCEIYYQVLDVTSALVVGNNAIGILLADGYFAGQLAAASRNGYGVRPQVKLMLNVDDVDGTQTVLTSDAGWRWHSSAILQADTHVGEHVDGRQQIPGWHDVQVASEHWREVQVHAVPEMQTPALPSNGPLLRAQQFPGMAVTQVLHPETALRAVRQALQPGRSGFVYDFGQQLLGRVHIALACTASDDVHICYSLTEDFNGPHCTTDTYTSVGSTQTESISAKFALHGFRYVLVSFDAEVTQIENVQAMRIGIPELQGLSFRSDHPTLNKLFEVLENSYRAVASSVPMRGIVAEDRVPDVGYAMTWVPHLARDEHAHALINKWLNDFKTSGARATQAGATVPRLPDRHTAGAARDPFVEFEALVRILWGLYRFQGDEQALSAAYDDLRVIALGYRHLNPTLLRSNVDQSLYGHGTEGDMVATCTFYGALRLAAKIAAVLDRHSDRELISATADEMRSAFRKRYLSVDGYLNAHVQSAYVAAIYHELLSADESLIAQAQLTKLIQRSNYHAELVPAVVHGLLPVLTTARRLDLAYMVLLQTSEPSWLGHINRGNDLIGYDRDSGPLDIAQVGISEWLIESLIGISFDQAANPGEAKNIHVCPRPPFGQQFLAGSPVQFVEASLPTAFGLIELNWYIRVEQFELELTIPPTCTATITMPDGIEQQVQSGRHRFTMDFSVGGDGVPTLLDLTEDDYATQARR